MTKEEAKHILELCRPGVPEDRDDPLIAEALRLLAEDEELRIWFETEQAIDAQISAELNAVSPPEDLKASILVGMQAHAAKAEEESAEDENITPFPADDADPAWWARPWVGVAAVVAVLLVAASALRSNLPEESGAVQTAGIPGIIEFIGNGYEERMRGSDFDKRSDDFGELRAFLAGRGTPAPLTKPRAVGEMTSLGCFCLDYNGAKMSMICFKGDQVIHLITIDRSAVEDNFQSVPAVFEFQGHAYKVWFEGDQALILFMRGKPQQLPEII